MMTPGEVLGEYRLRDRLGEGAVGVVFRAERDGEDVALKLLREKLAHDETYRRRFQREARVAREVEHPNLVPVLDAGEVGRRYYLASRYVEGRSLKTEIATSGPLPLGRLVRLAADLRASDRLRPRQGDGVHSPHGERPPPRHARLPRARAHPRRSSRPGTQSG